MVSTVNVGEILQEARKASKLIASKSEADRNEVLVLLAEALRQNVSGIIEANQKDLIKMPDIDPKKDRLLLNEQRILELAKSTEEIVLLKDPAGDSGYSHRLDNGLLIEKKIVPLGVVGVIYESRPNVTIDIAALCIKSGNAAVLRGGSDAWNTNAFLVDLIHQVLKSCGLPIACVSLYPPDRELVRELLHAERYVDIIIPRGSAALIQYVRENSKIPTIETGAGVCHTYVAPSADLDAAAKIVVNAKVSRPSVCNSLDTILVHEAVVEQLCQKILAGMQAYKVEVFADDKSYEALFQAGYPYLNRAEEEDFGKEFLDYKCSIKTVKSLDEALQHIETYSSRHSEAIVTQLDTEIECFIREVDAAAVYANASTRFTDGGVFGLGAEIGISTQKLHARGPFALEKLTTEKWVALGNGQIRE